MAEVMTARRAVVFAQELSLSKVVVGDDCLLVVSALNASVCYNTLYGNVVEETRHQACKFLFCRFSHVRQDGNKLAHALARRVVSSTDLDVWVEELPFDLESVFQYDLS